MRLCSSFAALLAVISCSAGTNGEGSPSRDAARAPAAVAPDIVPDSVADTVVIRGPGVPTASDDTLGTRYEKHEGPGRILEAPECRPAGFALCISDTASVAWSLPATEEGGIPDQRQTRWLVFAAERDSMQVFIAGTSEGHLTMKPMSAAGFFAEHAINDASWIRARFGHAGAYVYTVSIAADTPVPYELRVAPVIATAASRPIGRSATIIVEGDTLRRVAIAPARMARGFDSEAAWRQFAIKPGSYRMLLVRDTTYVVCALPCGTPKRLTVRPAQSVAVSP